jgi:RluA family pseudouridine synthase
MNTFNINNSPAEILYEDADVIAFVKPAGVLSQKAENGESSVLEYLNAYACGKWEAYPVHRLDRNTGGVMICAKNKKSAAALSALAATEGMKKEYLAAVCGHLEGNGTLEHDLFFDRRLNKSFPVKASARKGVKHAVLDYESLRHLDDPERTVVAVKLRTGRTHQIRCQLAAVGYPLLGDSKYGGTGPKGVCALWSHRITFNDTELAKTALKNSPFRKALKENSGILCRDLTSFPFGE